MRPLEYDSLDRCPIKVAHQPGSDPIYMYEYILSTVSELKWKDLIGDRVPIYV